MSLFSGAECSTSKNPLSGLSHHTDNSSASLSGRARHQQQQHEFAPERQMNSRDIQQMNAFQSSFNMGSIKNELGRLERRDWSGDFRDFSGVSGTFGSNGSSVMGVSGSSVIGVSGSSASAGSSQTSLPQPQQQQQAPRQYQPQYFGSSRRMVMSQFPNVQHRDHVMEQQHEPDWQQQFDSVEQEVSRGKEKEVVVDDDVVESMEADVDVMNDINKEFEEIWSRIKPDDLDSSFYERGMDSEFVSQALFDKYPFNAENQFEKSPDAYEIGLELMAKGAKLSEAALAFEAAVKQDPSHLKAWLMLGEIQSSNEREKPGIAANLQALKLDPNNLQALMNSSIGYINEGYDDMASRNLKQWLLVKYPESKPALDAAKDEDLDAFYSTRYDQVIKAFIGVIRNNPVAREDADLQLGLGVLFYTRGEFKKTVDCFETALKSRPDNEVLWNRLGAALANDGRSEEAVRAYHKALSLKPSFVRARYNLGIACINIGCYKEAAESLLAGISLHRVEGSSEEYKDGFDISKDQSDNLLETLKRAFVMMERRDLVEKVGREMNLNDFKGEFSF